MKNRIKVSIQVAFEYAHLIINNLMSVVFELFKLIWMIETLAGLLRHH